MGWEDYYHADISGALLAHQVPPDRRPWLKARKHSENHKSQRVWTIALRAAMLGEWKTALPLVDPWLDAEDAALLKSEPGLASHVAQHEEAMAAGLRACEIAGDTKRRDRVRRLVVGLLWIAQSCDPHRTGEIICPGARSTRSKRDPRPEWMTNSRQGGAARTLYRDVFGFERAGRIDKPGGIDIGAMLAAEVAGEIDPSDVLESQPPAMLGGPLEVTVYPSGHVATLPHLVGSGAIKICSTAWSMVEGRRVVAAGYDVEPPAELIEAAA